MRQLLAHWGIGVAGAMAPTPSGSGQTWFVETAAHQRYVLKATDGERAERERGILLQLSKTCVPVALPMATLEGDWCVHHRDGRVYCLYARLPGAVVDDLYGGDAEAQALRFGRAIGLLHTCLRECVAPLGHHPPEIIVQVADGAIPCLRERRGTVNAGAIERIWQEVESELGAFYGQLPQQLIHRDANTTNMLFSAGQLTGWLDFDQVRRGARLFDVCYCGRSVLLEGFDDQARARRWPDLFRSLVRGYQEYYPLTGPERRATYGMFVAIELLFIAFFVKGGDSDFADRSVRLLQWLATNRDSLEI